MMEIADKEAVPLVPGAAPLEPTDPEPPAQPVAPAAQPISPAPAAQPDGDAFVHLSTV
mgnify:CR=1 FL=1